MKKGANIQVYWRNPPESGSAVITRTFSDGRKYNREVNLNSLLSPSEASGVLSVAMDYIYILIKRGKLKPYHHNNKVYLKMKDLIDYQKSKKPPGRPKKEAFLI
jgi:hypothetical protein